MSGPGSLMSKSSGGTGRGSSRDCTGGSTAAAFSARDRAWRLAGPKKGQSVSQGAVLQPGRQVAGVSGAT